MVKPVFDRTCHLAVEDRQLRARFYSFLQPGNAAALVFTLFAPENLVGPMAASQISFQKHHRAVAPDRVIVSTFCFHMSTSPGAGVLRICFDRAELIKIHPCSVGRVQYWPASA
jgi:hypothetical protein